MAAKTAKNPKRRSYANRVRALIISMFGLSKQDWAEQNKAWNSWFKVEKRDRNQHEVEALLKNDVRDAFKARVLAILFAPQATDVPFVGGECAESDGGLMFGENTMLLALSPILRTFAIELIGIYTRAVEDRPRYGTQILDALTILSPEDPAARQLFDRYSLFGKRSNYNQFDLLLLSKIPEEWKWLADAKIRKLILADKKTPPGVRMGVFEEYERCIPIRRRKKPFPYSDALLASQFEFLLKLPQGFYVGHIKWNLELLVGDAHKDLRHRFVRYMVLGNRNATGKFEIRDAGERIFAGKLLKEFGENDPELGEKLRSAFADANKYKRKQNAAARKRKARDNALLDRMR